MELSCWLFWPTSPSNTLKTINSRFKLFLFFSFFHCAAMQTEAKLASSFFFIKGRKCIYIALVVPLRQTDTNVLLPFSVWQPWALRFFIIICLVQVTNQALNRARVVTWHCASQWGRRLLRSSFLSWQPHGNEERQRWFVGEDLTLKGGGESCACGNAVSADDESYLFRLRQTFS